jgi:hypothetical protein
MKEQFDDKAKDTTTIKSMPVEQTKASKDELSEQELDKATGGTAVGPRGGGGRWPVIEQIIATRAHLFAALHVSAVGTKLRDTPAQCASAVELTADIWR